MQKRHEKFLQRNQDLIDLILVDRPYGGRHKHLRNLDNSRDREKSVAFMCSTNTRHSLRRLLKEAIRAKIRDETSG